MNNTEKYDAYEMKISKYVKYGKCQICNKKISSQQSQLAHIISQSKSNISKYGEAVIHDPLNMMLVCSLKCNSKVDIGHNLNSDLVATIIMSHEEQEKKQEAIENIVRENIKRKEDKFE